MVGREDMYNILLLILLQGGCIMGSFIQQYNADSSMPCVVSFGSDSSLLILLLKFNLTISQGVTCIVVVDNVM